MTYLIFSYNLVVFNLSLQLMIRYLSTYTLAKLGKLQSAARNTECACYQMGKMLTGFTEQL